MNNRWLAFVAAVLLAAVLLSAASVRAEEKEPAPIPTPYSGDWLTRSTLTGDWLGKRNEWAAKGFTVDADLTQIEQGVVGGGKSGDWEYGGRADLTAVLDTQKLGLWPGGFFTLELESNWKNSINGNTGALLPANTNQLFPEPTGDNFNVPQWNFAQFVSKYAGVLIGKIQTITGGDLNEFAHGKGATQFFNVGFNVNPALLVVPYSTLGMALVVLPTGDLDEAIVKVGLLSATGTASKAGFDDINGAIPTIEGRVRTGFFGLTGHQLVGALYSTKTYTSLDQRLAFVVDDRLIARKDDSWAVYYNFDQFLYEIDQKAGRGIGVFGRFGASPGQPNPVKYFYSLGVGAKGPFDLRPNDQFGIGYYYATIENPTFQMPFTTRSFLRDEWGFEAYYNVALTPWLLLTPDLQVIGPSQRVKIAGGRREFVGTATALGVRLQIIF